MNREQDHPYREGSHLQYDPGDLIPMSAHLESSPGGADDGNIDHRAVDLVAVDPVSLGELALIAIGDAPCAHELIL